MKHLQILCILLLLPFLAFSQGYRKLTRQGNKAYKEQDYATATINATRALQENPKFKKSVELFEKSIIKVNRWYELKIQLLEKSANTYQGITSVGEAKRIKEYYQKLVDVQNELLFFPEQVKLKNKTLVQDHTKEYNPQLAMATQRVNEYNLLAAQELYEQGTELFEKANQKSDFQKAYHVFNSINSYVPNYENSEMLMKTCVEKGSYRVVLLDPANSSGRTDTRFRVINTVMNQIRASLGNNLFAIPVKNIQEYSTYFYSDNYNGIQADVIIKITFNDWNYGTYISNREHYSNQKKRTKKDGTEVVYRVQGDLFTSKNYTHFDAIVEWISTADNTIISNYSLAFEENYEECVLVGAGDRRANDSGCSLVKKIPPPPSMENVFKNEFITQTTSLMASWFN